jgi:hypothetical protein
MSRAHDEWGTRLADVRVPLRYGAYIYALILAELVGTLRKRRAWSEATESLAEVGSLLADRMVEGDKRDERMADLTENMATLTTRMEQYGRTSVKLAAASLVVAVVALIVAVAAVLVG